MRTFGIWHRPAWERQRGATISLAALTVGRHVYLAQTPYGPVPAGLHPSARKHFGPYYVMPLLENGIPAVMLAVSAYNTDMRIGADGQLILPRLDGNSFRHSGVPATLASFASLTPEEAIVIVSRAANQKVARLPEMVLPGSRTLPIFALWKISLEGSASIARDNGQGREKASVIFLGRSGNRDTRVPEHQQPAALTLGCVGEPTILNCAVVNQGGDRTSLSYTGYIPEQCPIPYTTSGDPYNPGYPNAKG